MSRTGTSLAVVAVLALAGGAAAGAVGSASAPSAEPDPALPRSAASAAGALPVSHASSRRVQPQPPAGSCHARGRGVLALPDLRCTPGAISAAVTAGDLARTICASGYTERVRPPESITEPEKYASLRAYGHRGPAHAYEYDHLVPLELGGAPNDPRNLWPEPGASPNRKDALENRLRARVCDGQMTLAAAQTAIARNWVAAYDRYVA